MPFATNRGCRIAYDVAGTGPTVLFQTGLTGVRTDWADHGYVAAFADAYQVVTTDSLAHGDSDKPVDASVYAREQRAEDIAVVLDDLGVERAHVIGYSMGAWIVSGVLVHHPRRLASLVIGGWDPLAGLATSQAGVKEKLGIEMTFENTMKYAQKLDPEGKAWITPEILPALRCCWEVLGQLEGVETAIRDFDRPIMLWDGIDDFYYGAARAVATKYPHVRFLETPGDHAAALYDDGGEAKQGLRAFVDEAEKLSPAR